MMRCLVTGATGYIGGRLSRHLSEAGYEVRLGSRSPTPSKEGHSWVTTDFDSPDSLVEACEDIDVVIHLAAANEIECAADPEKATLVNTICTQRIANAAVASGVQRIVYFSTVHVYGSPLIGSISEETCPLPAHPYAISHHAAEEYLRYTSTKSPLAVQIVRLTNSFGYPISKDVNRWSLVVNDACRQLATTGRVVLRTPGTQVRDFITLTDVCRAVEVLLNARVSPSGRDTYNVGSEVTTSVRAIVESVVDIYREITGMTAEIKAPGASRASGNDSLHIDTGRLRNLGFVPTNNADDEIRTLLERCMEWFPASRERSTN